jgi:hypothetical protein
MTAQAAKSKKKPRSNNPFVQACIAEMGGCLGKRRLGAGAAADVGDDVDDDEDDISIGDEDDIGDLDDFIVCKPGRDYRSLFAKQFKYRCSELPGA